MKRSKEHGMQTFDQALFDLYSRGEITYEDALAHADSANDLRLLIKLAKDDGSSQETPSGPAVTGRSRSTAPRDVPLKPSL